MEQKKLIVVYTDSKDVNQQIIYENPPGYMSRSDEWVIFAKGLLAEKQIIYKQLLEVYFMHIFYDAIAEGLEELKKLNEIKE